MRNRDRKGFTLIELMVVIVLIGLLAGVVGPQVFSMLDSGKIDLCRSQIKELGASVAFYKLDRGTFPQSLDDLTTTSKQYPHGYIEATEILEDPWGGSYVFVRDGGKARPYLILSFGPDG